MARRPLRIGLSARIYHPLPGATGLQSKSLHYLEQSVAHWVMSREVMVFMIPSVSGDGIVHRSSIRLSDYPQYLDGLVLQGGADISPQSYGEEPVQAEWAGDRLRDAYEMELLHEFMEAGKPVLGICRGAQLINVALGGTLYQDIATQYDQFNQVLATNPDQAGKLLGGKLAWTYDFISNRAVIIPATNPTVFTFKMFGNLRGQGYRHSLANAISVDCVIVLEALPSQ